jgi:ATP-dependent phosphoenolpyruvate carboxykinase
MLFLKRTNEVDFEDVSITPIQELVTQYTILTTFNRVLLEKSHIFLTADSFGILPLSKLTPGHCLPLHLWLYCKSCRN